MTRDFWRGKKVFVTGNTGFKGSLPRLSAEMAKFGPDIVLHLAAQTVVLSAYEDPIETFSTNVVGTASVFESVKRLPGKCTVVNITTDKVYENVHWV